MEKQTRPWGLDQLYLLPPSARGWLPKEHLAFFILDLMRELDLSNFRARLVGKDPRGTRPYDPRMMTALLLYGYCIGVASSRAIEKATWDIVAFRAIAGEQHPDHTRIAEFRRQNLKHLRKLFLQVLHLCQEMGMVKLGHVALDGTKVQANASRHKAMSYERLVKNEKQLKEEIEELLKRGELTDRKEDKLYGWNKCGDEMPEELRRRETRLAKIREAKAALEEQARVRAEQEKNDGDQGSDFPGGDDGDGESCSDEPTDGERDDADLPSHHVRYHKKTGEVHPKAQRNFTDPESRIMKDGATKAFVQAYNCQIAVDEGHQIIVSQAVSNQPPDPEHLRPMLQRARRNCGQFPRKLTADNGYWSERNAAYCAHEKVDAHIATGKLKHGERPPPVRGRPPKGLDAKGRMRRKLRTKNGREIYARRKYTVEPVFGQIKEIRGFRRFLLRGIEKARAEWALICLGHNILKLHRARAAPA